VSRIEEWDPPRSFVDVQVKGPYNTWLHRHSFVAKGKGTLIQDQVLYKLPFDPLSRLLAGSKVEKDLRKIFAYRRKAMEEIFRSGD
jgi:ligand-binding SRPBCC domain-containing protein